MNYWDGGALASGPKGQGGAGRGGVGGRVLYEYYGVSSSAGLAGEEAPHWEASNLTG
jgi:hypothetical protein